MILNLDYIYGYYAEGSFIWLAEHSENATPTSIGIYKCVKTSTKIEPFMVSFASQVPSSYIDSPYNGRFGNIACVGDYLYIPYYNRSIPDSWDTLVKYSKVDLAMLRAKHIQVKGIVQEGYFKDQSKFSSITYQGLWNPILTTIDNYLYYLIDDVIFVLNPNDLSIRGEITFQDGFKALGITSLIQGGESWIAVTNKTEIRYIRANQIKYNHVTDYTNSISEVRLSPISLSITSKNQNTEFAKTYIYEGFPSSEEYLSLYYQNYAIVDPDGGDPIDTGLKGEVISFGTKSEFDIQYPDTLVGCPETIWTVAAATSSILGGSTIDQEGNLTIGSTACGSLKITATCGSAVSIHYVKVTDSGQWARISYCTKDPWGQYKYTGECIVGNLKYSYNVCGTPDGCPPGYIDWTCHPYDEQQINFQPCHNPGCSAPNYYYICLVVVWRWEC